MIIYNVFTDAELLEIETDLASVTKNNIWENAKHRRGKILDKNNVYPDSSGDIFISGISPNVKAIIRKFLYLTDTSCRGRDFSAFYQVFDRNASLGMHNDANVPFVATFYLNKTWSVNDGGLFVYTEGQHYNVFVPVYNSCNFNTAETLTPHCVTAVNAYACDKRYSIQVFAK